MKNNHKEVNKMECYRQGDVMLVKITKLPSKLKEKDKILALGEVTGHKHQFRSNQVQVFADEQKQQFVKLHKPARLEHEEHQHLEIPKGVFKVVLQREFDILEGTRTVLD